MIIQHFNIDKKWIKRLRKDLTVDRFEHSKRVSNIAYYLSIVHNVNREKVVKSAFLHDCAKCFRLNEMIKICRNNGYEPNKHELSSPALLHSKAGAMYAKSVYGVKDQKILDGILYHTTGRPKMSKLEKIIYISDFIEPGRSFHVDIAHIVEAAFKDLDLCMYYILKHTVSYISSKNKNKAVDPITKKTYEYYKKKKEVKNEK